MLRSLETAPTEFIEAAGASFAYRRVGGERGAPLVVLQHFSGTMDWADPSAHIAR
ncbi:MAG: hypothetical protein ACT4OF_03780 [Caulobacteraceae bacterium]